MSQLSAILDGYNQNYRSLSNEPQTDAYHVEIVSICHNLTLIKSRLTGRNVSMVDSFFELAEFLVRECLNVPPPSNEEVFCEVGITNHNPALMDHCLKCIVCRHKCRSRRQGQAKCHKSKYICEGCSKYHDRKIYLCLRGCFKKFHQNM